MPIVRHGATHKELTVPKTTSTPTLRKIATAALPAAMALCMAPQALAAGPATQQASAAACPSQSFFEFLHVFVDSAEVQGRFTRLQPRTPAHGAATPDAGAVVRVAYAPSTAAAIPLRAERQAQALSLRIDDLTEDQARVLMLQDGSNQRVHYVFSKQACWTLVRVETPTL
jgi:hypothetical protein